MADSAALWLRQAEESFASLLSYHLATVEQAVSAGLQLLHAAPAVAPDTVQRRGGRGRRATTTARATTRTTIVSAGPAVQEERRPGDEPSEGRTGNNSELVTAVAPTATNGGESAKESAAVLDAGPRAPSAPRARRGRPRKTQAGKPEAVAAGGAPIENANDEPATGPLPDSVLATPKVVTPATLAPSTIGSGISTIPRKRGRPRRADLGASSISASPSSSTAARQIPPTKPPASNQRPLLSKFHPATPTGRVRRPTLAPKPTIDLSSVESPLKTPVPVKSALSRPIATPILPKPPSVNNRSVVAQAAVQTPVARSTAANPEPPPPTQGEPKFESWTSRFVKNPSFGTSAGEKAPAPSAPPAPLPSKAPAATVISVGDAVLPATAVEFVPPPTVTRRAPRRDAAPPPPSIPMDYVESPLTRARRIDAQNTWREQQLRSFMMARADHLKSALEALRHERDNNGPKMDAVRPAEMVVPIPTSGGSVSEASIQKHLPPPPAVKEEAVEEKNTGLPLAQASATDSERQQSPPPEVDFAIDSNAEISPDAPMLSGGEEVMDQEKEEEGNGGQSPDPKEQTTPEAPLNSLVAVPSVDALQNLLPLIADEDMPESAAMALLEIETLEDGSAGHGMDKHGGLPIIQPTTTANPAQVEPEKTGKESDVSLSCSIDSSGSEGLSGRIKMGGGPLDPEEAERRRRLRERNEKALEKRKNLMQKAAQMKNAIADLSGKARTGPASKASHLPVRVTTAPMRAPGRASPSLQKQAMVNNAMRSASATTASGGEEAKKTDNSPEVPSAFRMPLPPKTRTPVKSPTSKRPAGEHPSSDDTFTIAKPSTTAVQSPRLPDIHSE